MKSTALRKEYVNTALIPDYMERGPFHYAFELYTFRIIELGFGDTLFNEREADAVTAKCWPILPVEEQKRIKAETGVYHLFGKTTGYRVIAYNGKPITTGEYPDVVDALRDAARQVEPREEQDTDKNV